MDENSNKVYFNLQCCRGIAAIMVLLSHVNQIVEPKLFHGGFIPGWCGVDFFFILSGFIIYYINAKYFGQKQYIKSYLVKRFIRIFPIYWFYTTLFLITSLIVYTISGSQFIGWITLNFSGIIRSLTLYPTHVKINEMPIIPAAWTLTYELTFYLFFGITLLTNKRTFYSIVGVWIVLIILMLFKIFPVSGNSIIYTFSNPRNIEFVIGCFIGELTLKNKIIKNKLLAFILLVISFLLLCFAWFNEIKGFRFIPQFPTLYFAIILGIVIYTLISLENFKTENWLKSILLYLGDASYSIYLIHYIIIVIINDLAHQFIKNENFIFFMTTTLASGIGCLSYSFLEKPLLQYMRNLKIFYTNKL